MGNSGSLHHDEQYPTSWVQSMPRDAYHHRQSSTHFPHHQVKVLPELNGGPRLRTTNNGQILQQGGTISVKNQGLQRSRSVSAPHHYAQTGNNAPMTTFQPQFLKARSQTQINFIPRESPTRDLANSKKFGSESDLKEKMAKEANEIPPKLPPKQKGSHLKKRRAPDVPNPASKVSPSLAKNHNERKPSLPPTNPPIRNDGINRKLRLFKTKAEMKKTQNENTKQLPQESSDTKSKPYMSTFAKKSEHTNNNNHNHSSNNKNNESHNLPFVRSNSGKNQPITDTNSKSGTTMDWKKNVSKLPGIFRREKSFDLSLMSEMNRQREIVEQQNRSAISPPLQRKSISGNKMDDRKLPRIPVPPKMSENKRPEAKPPVIKSYVRKQIQPIVNHKNDFQQELLQATKRRSLAVSDIESKVDTISTTTSKSTNNIKHDPPVVKKEGSPKEKSPSPDKIVITVKDIPPRRSQTESPSIDKSMPRTFYFGMGDGDDKIERQTEEDVDREQMELIDRFAESILIQQRCTISSESALSSDTEDLDIRRHDSEALQEISLSLRPTLPRKQFEIPRFSPAAAWRLLASEEDKREDTMEWLNNVEKAHSQSIEVRNHDEADRGEERIERIYREPIPGMQTDNKSGDSGISGDAGLPERVESPRNRQRKPDINFPGAWTPQQDLGEESSTDEDPEESIKRQLNTFNTKGHVFSLTLPRDIQTPTFSDKSDKNTNSNNKIQKNTNTSNDEIELENETLPVVASDNWFLSRSTPTPLDAPKIVAASYKTNISVDRYSREEQDQFVSPLDSSETISYLASGKHRMYLPNKDGYSLPVLPCTSYEDEIKVTKLISNVPPREMDREFSPIKSEDSEERKQELPIKMSKSKKFTFQSTVRQVQRRKIAEKLSRQADEQEAHRLSELEVMRKVEEEFQKKRAREKASIRQQLQMYSLEESQQCYNSLPNEWDAETRRSEPEGASPVPGNSPTGMRSTGTYKKNSSPKSAVTRQDSNDTFVDTKTPYISRIIEQKSGRLDLNNKSNGANNNNKVVVDIQPYQQRIFGDRHHQSSMSHQNYLSSTSNITTIPHTNHNSTTSNNVTPLGNQFIRGHSYRNSESSEISEHQHHHISTSHSLNTSRHFQSLMTSTYDKIFQ